MWTERKRTEPGSYRRLVPARGRLAACALAACLAAALVGLPIAGVAMPGPVRIPIVEAHDPSDPPDPAGFCHWLHGE